MPHKQPVTISEASELKKIIYTLLNRIPSGYDDSEQARFLEIPVVILLALKSILSWLNRNNVS